MSKLAPNRAAGGVDRRRLVRILAVSQLRLALEPQRHRGRELRVTAGRLPLEPGADRLIVRRRVDERLGRQPPPQFECDAAGLPQLCDDLGILPGIGGDRREGVILGRRAHQARAANVNLLDRLLGCNAWLGDRLAERVQIDHHEIKRRDAVLVERRHVVGPVAPAQHPGEYLGVQCLDAAVHHLGEAGIGRHVVDLEPLGLQAPPCAAGAVDAGAGLGQNLSQLAQTLFIAHANQRIAHGLGTHEARPNRVTRGG